MSKLGLVEYFAAEGWQRVAREHSPCPNLTTRACNGERGPQCPVTNEWHLPAHTSRATCVTWRIFLAGRSSDWPGQCTQNRVQGPWAHGPRCSPETEGSAAQCNAGQGPWLFIVAVAVAVVDAGNRALVSPESNEFATGDATGAR